MDPIKIVTKDNLEKYTEIIKEKLDERISEPEDDGNEGNVLATDGDGTRYWKEVEFPESCTDEEVKEIFSDNKSEPSRDDELELPDEEAL